MPLTPQESIRRPIAAGNSATPSPRLTEQNVLWWGALADGSTDSTAVILAMLTALGASFAGIIFIPYNVKFNFTTVMAALPVKAIVDDQSAINAYDTAGFRQRVIGFYEKGDPTAVVDLQYRISSGHNAALIIDNRGTAGSVSALSGIAAVHWGRGQLTREADQHAVRTLSRHEWAKIGGQDKWWWVLRRVVPWIARNWEYWYTGKSYTTGDYVVTVAGVYRATTTGTAGATSPDWLKGVTASDGGVSWICVNNAVDDSLFLVNENGEIALNATPTAGIVAYLKASAESNGDASLFVEATGISKFADMRLRPTDGAAAVVTMPYWRCDTISLRLIQSGGVFTGCQMTDARGFELGVHGHTETLATDLDTTPSVENCGVLILANTGATSITALDDSKTTQQVMLIFENGNTTLVHNAGTFLLRGGINVTPAAFGVIVMKKYTRSAAWFEISRNF